MKNEHGLTQQQEAFAVSLASGMSQVEAYRKAYPRSKAWKDEATRVNASKMSADANVVLRVKGLQADAADIAVLKAADILEETRRIALSNAAGIIGMKDGKPYVLMPNELDAATVAAVKSFKIDDLGRIEYTFWDKNAALERATKILGMYEKDNSQKTDPLTALLQSLNGNVIGPGGAGSAGDDDA